jgi:YrhK-like protein
MRPEAETTEEHRFGPFVTYVVRKRPDGMIARWESRSHRKHLSGDQPRGSTWWAPQDRDWWIGVLFAIGSFLFGLGTVPGYANAVGARPDAVTFFIGSIFFTSAGFLQYREAVDAAPKRPGTTGRKVFVWLPGQIDWLATGIQSVGTLEFNISTFAAIWAATGTAAARHHVWRPDVLGSVCFLVASLLAWFEACHGWAAWRPRSLAWWITGVNLAGSVAFGFSAVASYVIPGTTELLSVPVTNLGTFVGAVCFFAGAVLLLFERTEPVPAAAASAQPRLPGPAPAQPLSVRAYRHLAQSDRYRLGRGVGRPRNQGHFVFARGNPGQIELRLTRTWNDHRLLGVPARSVPAQDAGDRLQPRTRPGAADHEHHSYRGSKLGTRARGHRAGGQHVDRARRVDDRGAVDAQRGPLRGGLGRERLSRELGGVILAQLTEHPAADRLNFPAGPDLRVPFGLDLGPLGLDATLPGVAHLALTEDDHERGRRLPFRGIRQGLARGIRCGLDRDIRHGLGQHAPGLFLPARYLVPGGAGPQVGHRPVDDLPVGLHQATKVGDAMPGEGAQVLILQALDRAQLVTGHRKLLSSFRWAALDPCGAGSG